MNVMPRRLLPPPTRIECPPASEPCRRILCRYHLWHDRALDRHGSVVDLHETGAFGDVRHTCALRQAAHGPKTLAQIATALGCTREWVRQVQEAAFATLREGDPGTLRDLLGVVADVESRGNTWEEHGRKRVCHAAGEEGPESTSDDTGWPEQGESDESGAPEYDQPDSTSRFPAARLAQWRYRTQLRREALAEAAEASPLVPCPRCGTPMHALTRAGKQREVCGKACAHRFPPPPPPRMGPGTGPAGDSGDDGPGFPLATWGKRRSHCSHGRAAAQATAP